MEIYESSGRMARKKGLFEVLGLNINGDLPDEKIVEVALKADEVGVVIWIGENELFKDPFYVADLIANFVSVPIGFGIVSPLRRSCSEIIDRVRSLMNRYSNEFLLGIAPGKFKDPKTALEITLRCLRRLKRELGVPIFCGCSSPLITAKASKIADGILFNYCHPDFLRWISRFAENDVIKVAFAPSLILPSEFEQDLLLACAIVSCSSRKFVEEFGFVGMCKDFAELDFGRLISIRQKRENLLEVDEFKKVLKYKGILLEKFSVSGSLDEVKGKINDILKICDHIVLGDPFFRDRKAVDLLIRLLEYFK